MILFGCLSSSLLAGFSPGGRALASAPVPLDLACGGDFRLDLTLIIAARDMARTPPADQWFEEVNWNWIPQAGIRFHLGIDGLSLLLVLLTLFLGSSRC